MATKGSGGSRTVRQASSGKRGVGRPRKHLRRCESHVEAVRELILGSVLKVEWQCEDQLTMTVTPDALPDVVAYLYYKRDGYLSSVLGNDERTLCGRYAVYYVLSMEGIDPGWVTVRCEVDPEVCEWPSVTPRVPACVWGEREVRDMYGLEPQGLPDRRRLLLPDDWPAGVYPLRKDAMDYRYRPEPISQVETYSFLSETQDRATTVVPMGPLHVAADEPGHFRLFVDGETIVDADYRLFYAHRGMEKIAETRLDYDGVTFLADRVCGICGCSHAVAYAQSVERALNIEVPERAQCIRAIMIEVERLHSHLLNLGLMCHYAGFDAGFMHLFRVRERSMELAEILTGARKTYGLNVVGGVRRDILRDQRTTALEIIRTLSAETREVAEAIMTTANFESRLSGVGVLAPQVARDYSCVGPTIRGSGLARDARRSHPFGVYADALAATDARANKDDRQGAKDTSKQTLFSPQVTPRTLTGDALSRTVVRLDEVYSTCELLEELLQTMPNGALLNEDWEYKPHLFAIGCVEAPRGENMHWTMTGDNQKCYRWHAKAATYSNWPALRYMLRGNTLADAPLILGSIDPCYSCTDRVTVIDVPGSTAAGRVRQWSVSKERLERYCVQRTHSPLLEDYDG